MSFASLRQFFRDNPRMWIVLTGALLVTATIVFWAFGGFGVGLSRFFAMEDVCENAQDSQANCESCGGEWFVSTDGGDYCGPGSGSLDCPAGETRDSEDDVCYPDDSGCDPPYEYWDGNSCEISYCTDENYVEGLVNFETGDCDVSSSTDDCLPGETRDPEDDVCYPDGSSGNPGDGSGTEQDPSDNEGVCELSGGTWNGVECDYPQTPTGGDGGAGTPSCVPTYRSCSGDDIFQHYTTCPGLVIVECGSVGCDPLNNNTAAVCRQPAVGQPEPERHLECRNNTCTMVGGDGEDSCDRPIGSACGTTNPSNPAPGSPTSPTGSHTSSVLTVQCGPTQNILTWNLPAGHTANGLLRSVDGATNVMIAGIAAGATSHTDTNIQAGHTYTYHHKPFADTASNGVTCSTVAGALSTAPPPPGATPTPMPIVVAVASPSPTPQSSSAPTPVPSAGTTPLAQTASPAPGGGSVSAVLCAPDSQVVAKSESAYVEAVGGNGRYTWTTSGGGTQQDGGSGFVAFSYLVTGTKTVTVQSGGQRATCTVIVATTIASVESPQPSGPLMLAKRARNTSRDEVAFQPSVIIQPGETVEFELQIQSPAVPAGTVLTIRDTLPEGMSYQSGSTLIDGSPSADGIITNTGLQTGTESPGQTMTVQWIAVADRTYTLSSTFHETRPGAIITAGPYAASAGMSVTVVGSGTSSLGTDPDGSVMGSAGQIQTGPGYAVVLALTVAAMVTLLYTGYTRSPSFRRKEVEQIQRDQGPLDFRS